MNLNEYHLKPSIGLHLVLDKIKSLVAVSLLIFQEITPLPHSFFPSLSASVSLSFPFLSIWSTKKPFNIYMETKEVSFLLHF